MSPCRCGTCGELYYFLLMKFDTGRRNVCDLSHWHWVMSYDWYAEVCKIRTLRAGVHGDQGPAGRLFGLEVEVTRTGGKPHLVGPWFGRPTIGS